jgi:hypothetical protein
VATEFLRSHPPLEYGSESERSSWLPDRFSGGQLLSSDLNEGVGTPGNRFLGSPR